MPDLETRIDNLESRVEDRLSDLERKVDGLLEVCAAVADDTLRVCFVLDELSQEGKLPTLPWDVATALVELHHATQAAKSSLVDGSGVLSSQRVEELKAHLTALREQYRNFVREP